MEWMRFLLKRRKSFCVSGVFFFPDDNITQVDTQQYCNQNKMEKLIYCSFFASENILIQIWRMLFFFFFFFLYSSKKHLQNAETNCFVMCSLLGWVSWRVLYRVVLSFHRTRKMLWKSNKSALCCLSIGAMFKWRNDINQIKYHRLYSSDGSESKQ